MRELFPVLEAYEIWIYAFLGLALLFYIRKLILAAREMRAALFGFEKAVAHRKLSISLTFVVIFGLLMLAEFVLVSFVAPALPSPRILATPTMDLLTTPTVALPPASFGSTPTVELAETTPAPISAEGCLAGRIEWAYPRDGDVLQGAVNVVGTVNVENLGFYKYEYVQAGSTEWVTVAAGNQAVVNGKLQGTWNTSQLIPGDYQLRLVVTDNQNNTFPACIVSIRVVGE